MASRDIVGVLTILLAVAGCAEPFESSRPTATSTPTVPAMPFLNLTACAGGILKTPTPIASLRPHVPTNFEIVEALPGHGMVLLDFLLCEKIAINGVDRGPAQIQKASIAVRAPNGGNFDGRSGLFVVESRTNSSELATVLPKSTLGLSYVQTRGSLTISYDTLKGEARGNSGTLYQFDTFHTKGTANRTSQLRIFFSEQNGTISAFDYDARALEAAGDGRGHVSAASGTFLGRAFMGPEPIPTGGNTNFWMTSLWVKKA